MRVLVRSIQPIGQTTLRVVDRRSGHLHVRERQGSRIWRVECAEEVKQVNNGVPDVKMIVLSRDNHSLLT